MSVPLRNPIQIWIQRSWGKLRCELKKEGWIKIKELGRMQSWVLSIKVHWINIEERRLLIEDGTEHFLIGKERVLSIKNCGSEPAREKAKNKKKWWRKTKRGEFGDDPYSKLYQKLLSCQGLQHKIPHEPFRRMTRKERKGYCTVETMLVMREKKNEI